MACEICRGVFVQFHSIRQRFPIIFADIGEEFRLNFALGTFEHTLAT